MPFEKCPCFSVSRLADSVNCIFTSACPPGGIGASGRSVMVQAQSLGPRASCSGASAHIADDERVTELLARLDHAQVERAVIDGGLGPAGGGLARWGSRGGLGLVGMENGGGNGRAHDADADRRQHRSAENRDGKPTSICPPWPGLLQAKRTIRAHEPLRLVGLGSRGTRLQGPPVGRGVVFPNRLLICGKHIATSGVAMMAAAKNLPSRVAQASGRWWLPAPHGSAVDIMVFLPDSTKRLGLSAGRVRTLCRCGDLRSVFG